MRQPVNNAIQYGANEGIPSPSCVLYSFLQPLLLLNASPSLQGEVTGNCMRALANGADTGKAN